MSKEGRSPRSLPLFTFSFNFFVVFLVCLFVLITVKKTETKPPLGLSPTPSTLLRAVLGPHNRQRQKRVGMKTPKATRMGNMRLLLSEA